MNVYEGITIVLVTISTLIRVQDAQEDDTISVAGPETFVTDGTKELMLTCGTDISASVGHSWRFPTDEPRVCESRPVENVCSFRPRLDDDMQNVTCAATNIDEGTFLKATYTLRLFYPPQSSAAIEPPQTEPLKQGDIITCTVSGGKPRVTNVTFHCQHPDHADREDDVSDDGLTVSSSITVNTSQAAEVNMTCNCSAHWDPDPELYDNITNAEFMLKCRATVTNFTVNGSTSKTVAESQKVMFWCQGAGRPSPTLILRKRGNDTAIRSDSPPEERLLHYIGSARCEDLGNYTCEANDNFPDPQGKTVQLFVKCSTRPADDSVDIANIYNLTRAGRTFTVIGYPTPEIAVVFCGNNATSDCQPAAESAFNKSCTRNQSAEHLVDCTITPVNMTEDKTGLYNMTMKNTMGNVTVTFQILHADETNGSDALRPRDETNGSDALRPRDTNTLAIGLGAAGGVVGLATVLALCLLWRPKRSHANNDNNPTANATPTATNDNPTAETAGESSSKTGPVTAQPADSLDSKVDGMSVSTTSEFDDITESDIDT
ncbi:uncharacterized protein [Littorina saxatilis]|uniref:uncharacterized protein isoform X2 n=1 Tax=Littorina saxatilis TaxID=31220 RepID=UPI0038B470DA